MHTVYEWDMSGYIIEFNELADFKIWLVVSVDILPSLVHVIA